MAFSRRKLGSTGLTVSPVGIGGGYGITSPEILRAFDRGVNYFFYGTWIPTYRHMESGLKEILHHHRDEVVLATGAYFWLHPSRLEAAVTKHLKRLGTDFIDVFHIAHVVSRLPRAPSLCSRRFTPPKGAQLVPDGRKWRGSAQGA
jgi:aryl-alcohol dehydrogenase-like predicted oxidoreductase